MNAFASRELILGGCRSGKSRAAETRAMDWLNHDAHEAVLIATAQAGDDEMAERIARHRADRLRRVPRLATVEEPIELAGAIATHSAAHRLLVVDCLTLWLTQHAMPLRAAPASPERLEALTAELAHAVEDAKGPIVLVSNEIGLGLMPMSRETRAFVDALGRLHQSLTQVCHRVTFMVAGCEWQVKDNA
ncbi:MAG TPA: bifunctional adenosylcobinamide kinase/adenosylcobinamide-phosphate guanylyltransferase [Burkholderiaceae bacterium]|nr:bifunctional adenosylcobinamide kinase/adenosylcobinamide-phosphate guanylyltransferase [Burkholderiaceae bacterium]